MKIMKRVVATALVVAMSAASLIGCGKKSNNSTTGLVDEEGNYDWSSSDYVQLDCYSQLANSQGTQTGWFGAILKNKFHVELNIINETGSTFATLMEAGDLGDMVVFGSAGDNYLTACEQGMLFDWEKYDILNTYGTYIRDNMSAALEHNRDISGTGSIYGFGHSVASTSEDHEPFFYSWDLRYDYYVELGCPTINNLDDLITVFEDMKKNHPTDDEGKETYAISLWPDWDGNMVMYVKALATAYYGYDELGLGLYNNETGEFYDALMVNDDGSYGPYLEMLQFFNKLYQKGLLDPDSNIQTYDDAVSKVKTGRTFWSIFNYAGSAAFNTDENIADGKAMYTVVPEEATPCVYGMNVLGGNRIWAIGSTSAYPDRVMSIYNYLCTPEGWLDQQYGPEGLCWYYAEDDNGNTKCYFTELGAACKADNQTVMESDDAQYADYCGSKFVDGQQQMNNLTWSTGATDPNTGEKYDSSYWSSTAVAPADGSIEAQWRENTGATSTEEYLCNRTTADGEPAYSVAKASAYSEGTQDADLKIVWTEVTEEIVRGSWNAIKCSSDAEFEKAVESMIKEANSYDNGNGYKECVEWSQNEANARKAAEDAIASTEGGLVVDSAE